MVPGEGKGCCISIVVATASTGDSEKVVELNYPMQEQEQQLSSRHVTLHMGRETDEA